jgi:hypothetical protein
MKPSEAVELIGQLRDAFPRQVFTPANSAVYAEHIVDLPHEAACCAVRALIARSRWMPSIAEIREATAREVLCLPSPAEAWEEFRANMRRWYEQYNAGGTIDELTWSSPVVERAATALGGIHALYDSPNVQTDRAHFLRLYGEFLAAAIDEAVTGQLPPRPLRAIAGGARQLPLTAEKET